jgi:acyl-CoA reductase-like NAD-dependent aldehyde dehydrogenase
MRRYLLHVGGTERPGAAFELVRSPYDGTPVAEVAVGNAADMEAAVAAATRGFAQTRRLPTHERARLLEGVSAKVRARKAELAELIARESGKPIRYARGEVERATVTFALGAAVCRELGGEVLPIDQLPGAEGRLCLYRRVPKGPIAALSPFNFPLNLVAHKLSPALAVGAPVVLKPPPQAPLTAHVLAEIVEELGAPPGAFNVVHCPPDVAERMVRDDRLKVLSFTGSDVVGWRLKSIAGKKTVLLELGGNAPCVIDEGVDLGRALPRIVEACWANAGQICIKAQRVLVHRSLYDEFLERLVEATRAIEPGDPLNEDTVVGPVIRPEHAARIVEWVREAAAGGARLLLGGEASGQLVSPAILTGTRPEMRVCRNEVFGPVTVVEPFANFAEALAVANASRFGIQASVFTNDLGRALSAFEELEYGGVLINDVPTFRADNFPYGGVKDSGLGREGVRYAAEEFCEAKVLILKPPPE